MANSALFPLHIYIYNIYIYLVSIFCPRQSFKLLAVFLDSGVLSSTLLLFFTFQEFSGRSFSVRYVPDLIFLGWIEDGFCVFCPADPSAQCRGRIQAIGPAHSIVTPTGHVSRVLVWVQVFLGVLSVTLLLASPIPPPFGSWERSGQIDMVTHTGARDRLAFRLSSSIFFSYTLSSPPPLAGDMAMAFVDDLFLSLAARPPVLSFLLIIVVFCRLCNLAVQRQVWEWVLPYLRLMFQLVESGFP